MKSLRLSLLILATAILCSAAWWSRVPAQELPDNEEEIHLAPGAKAAGSPATADPRRQGKIQLSITDAATGEPTFCRVNVVGPDGNYYEPDDNPLKTWSLSRLGNRKAKGPFRYYGWFFYTDGTCEVAVPPGEARIEVWKGFEFVPAVVKTSMKLGETVQVGIELERAVDMAARGWYGGDTHIHLDRRNDADDARVLDLAAVEDIRFAHILCMNDPRTYQPVMDQQTWLQMQGMGTASVRKRGIYQIASGQEYRCSTFGHICLVGESRLVDADGLKTDPNNWPVFGVVSDECRSVGGRSFHAHGGYEQEIYADFVQRATDGVELLQFAEYRGISLAGWYHILNAGFRFPAVGASDFPYCRALGDCRTYVYLEKEPTFESWIAGAAAGRSFFTTGPLLEVKVNGKRPGETLELPAGEHRLEVAVTYRSPVAVVQELQVIVNGTVTTSKLPGKEPLIGEQSFRTEVPVREPTWVAVRLTGRSPNNREDAEAHTNPVYVHVGGKAPFRRESVVWLLEKLDGQIAKQAERTFPQREQVLAYFNRSREILAGMAGN